MRGQLIALRSLPRRRLIEDVVWLAVDSAEEGIKQDLGEYRRASWAVDDQTTN